GPGASRCGDVGVPRDEDDVLAGEGGGGDKRRRPIKPQEGDLVYELRSDRLKVNVEPTPNSLFTQIRPPCSSTNFRHRVNPSPVPSTFLSAVPTCPHSS